MRFTLQCLYYNEQNLLSVFASKIKKKENASMARCPVPTRVGHWILDTPSERELKPSPKSNRSIACQVN